MDDSKGTPMTIDIEPVVVGAKSELPEEEKE